MLGMGIGEILIVAIVAVIVLGPDKLPSAMVNIAKFFKIFKQTINGAKSTFEQEIKIAELKGISVDEVVNITTKNAKSLFDLEL